eukprot:9021577-Ditylum_brightwellii.AAC.1
MNGPDADVDIILKKFTLLLPSADSYPNPVDACADLAIGGDMNLNRFVTFPMRINTSLLKLFKMEEEGNKFYCLQDKTEYYHRLHQTIPRIQLNSKMKKQLVLKSPSLTVGKLALEHYIQWNFDGYTLA